MKTISFIKAGLLALGLVTVFVVAWECYWRNRGFKVSYNDDEALWAYTRAMIYESSAARPVLIGSSRIKFDLDLNTWERIAGEKPIQLALEGTNPRPLLADLANDPKFKGTIIMGVTEVLFFQPDHTHFEIQAEKRLKFYPHWPISQQAGFYLNKFLESNLLFLQENTFSLNALLKRLPIESRPGVFVFPNFPLKFAQTQFDRQTSLTDDFVKSPEMQVQMQENWKKLAMQPRAASGGDTLTGIIQSVKKDVDKIRSRGGEVVFLREPSNGPYLENEKQFYPRDKFWERLLKETGVVGIHYADFPALSKYTCPEWSHLTPQDAITFTQDLIPILEEKTGWKIKK